MKALASRRGRMLAAALSAGTLAVASGSADAAQVGQLCNVNSDTPVWSTPGNGWMYTIPAGGGFRITGFGGGWWYGHGNAMQDGWVSPDRINEATCRW